MPRRQRTLWTCDCETDPFLHARVPQPFVWGAYAETDGVEQFKIFETTDDFIYWASTQHALFYAHNGGKFDFMYLLPYLGEETRPQIINGRIVEFRLGEAIFRDSFAIIPTSLGAYKKDDFDYSKMESSVRAEHMDEIISYLRNDCRYLYELVSEYRETAGKRTTIASNALAYCRRLGINPGKTNKKYDDKFRPFYFGGRVQAFKTGKVNGGIQIYDINSAYPFAMIHKHPTGYRWYEDREPDGADFVLLRCHSRGAFPRREKQLLIFPDDYGMFSATRWEYETAMKHGLLSDIEIVSCFHFENHIEFGRYVEHWHKRKQFADDIKDPAKRLIAKIMLNSLYGKLAQNPFNYSDYKLVPVGTEPEEGWSIGEICGEYEVHERSAAVGLEERYGELLDDVPLFLNVATAASITGFVRAMLLDAMHTVGIEHVAYCDTDCLFVSAGHDEALDRGKHLGQWSHEGYCDAVYIGGRKLYVTTPIHGANGKPIINPATGKPYRKSASKGARLSADEIERVAMGETVVWKNDAPTFRIGREPDFVVRKISATG